jgi:hypothetical protein
MAAGFCVLRFARSVAGLFVVVAKFRFSIVQDRATGSWICVLVLVAASCYSSPCNLDAATASPSWA